MNHFGELLYTGKTDNNKNGFVFVLLGIMFLIVANFIYAKTFALVVGGLFTLFGLYLLLFKRSEEFFIYENAIVLNHKGQEVSIPKEQISHIEYQKIKARRSLIVNYYPVLVLSDQKKVLLNKVFNSSVNQDFKKVLESYI